MKRGILGVMAFALVFAACKKEEPATPASPGSCTVSGTVTASTDLSNDTLADGTFIPGFVQENVGSVKMTFVVNSGNLDHNPAPGYDYKDLTYTATVSDGAYSVTLPAISTPYTVDVYFDDFVQEQRQFVPGEVVFETKKFFLGATSIGGILEGVNKVQNFTYNY